MQLQRSTRAAGAAEIEASTFHLLAAGVKAQWGVNHHWPSATVTMHCAKCKKICRVIKSNKVQFPKEGAFFQGAFLKNWP